MLTSVVYKCVLTSGQIFDTICLFYIITIDTIDVDIVNYEELKKVLKQ